MDLTKQQRYATLSIILHWIMFLLLVAKFSRIEIRDIYLKGSETKDTLKTGHFMVGLSVFVIDFDPNLKPDMFARMLVEDSTKEVLSVPVDYVKIFG
jgi:hypothetical protein